MQRSTEQLTRCSTVSLEEEKQDKTGNPAAGQTVPKIMSVCKNTLSWMLFIDAIIALSVILLLTLLEVGVVPHNKIGFFCNDEKISRKFIGDTISVTLLLMCSVIAPVVMMWLVEYICHSSDSYSSITGSCGSRLKQIWFWYGHYIVGLVSLIFVTAIMKVLIGEPRPHFLETCRPREAFNCTNEYIKAYTCTNTVDSTWFVSDSSKSFPSGHSAISMYTTIFLVCYLQNRLTRKTLLIKPWLQCVVSVWTMVCSLTRITDNRHHWWDVLVGDTIGVVFSVLVIAVSCRNFRVGVEKYLIVRVPKDSIVGEQKNTKKLLNSIGEMDTTEGRELRDVTASWKE